MDSNNKELVEKGKILIAQGETPGFIPFLQKGIVEILSASNEFDGLDPQIVASKSRRVGVIRGESFIAGFNSQLTGPYKKTIRTIADSYIAKYPVNQGGIKDIAQQNTGMALNLVNHIFKRLESSISEASKYTKLYQNLNRIDDNIAIMHKSLASATTFEKLQDKADNLYNMYTSGGGKAPSTFDAKFLIADNSQYLRKKYSFPGLPLESLVDYKQCQLIKKFLKLNSQVLGAVSKGDPSIIADMYDILSDNLLKILDRIDSIHREIDSELSAILGGDSSWSSFFVEGGGLDAYLNTNRISPEFTKNFLSLIKKIHGMYEEISGKSLIENFNGCKKIHGYYVSKSQGSGKPAAAARPAAEGARPAASKGAYQNSMQQIFEYALIDKETQKKMLKSLNEFKNMSNPFNTETEGRKARKQISKLYWDIYKQVYIRSKKESSMPPPAKLMLRFGFFDDDLLEADQIQEMHSLLSAPVTNAGYEILFETEFLDKIYSGKINPSITEMGQSYEAFLRDEEKHGRSKDKNKTEGLDENTKKTMYEIDHMLATTVAVCSGSTSTAFPILTSLTLKGNLDNYYVSHEKLAQTVKNLLEVDYSAFYRETVVKLGNAREVIEEEILPNFILLPSHGAKTMLWQELDGTNRKTRGRIVIPIFFIGDLAKSLAHSFACFRWELNRTIKGGMWADPVEGGITGVYFDYVNFYKKNRKLSMEAKDKITEKFRSIRTNRDRFADDYTLWVLYEKDGIMRVNNVIREMFYRFIPFRKELRDRLENMPAYNEIAPRYKNIQSRNVTQYERRYKKYLDDNGNLPEPLQKYMDFLNS